jgi:hypothetical protein
MTTMPPSQPPPHPRRKRISGRVIVLAIGLLAVLYLLMTWAAAPRDAGPPSGTGVGTGAEAGEAR